MRVAILLWIAPLAQRLWIKRVSLWFLTLPPLEMCKGLRLAHAWANWCSRLMVSRLIATYTYNQDAGDLADSGTSTEALTFTLTDAGATDPNPVTPLTFALVAAPEAAEFLELTGTPATITENVDYTTEAIIAAADYTVTGATGAVSYTFR